MNTKIIISLLTILFAVGLCYGETWRLGSQAELVKVDAGSADSYRMDAAQLKKLITTGQVEEAQPDRARLSSFIPGRLSFIAVHSEHHNSLEDPKRPAGAILPAFFSLDSPPALGGWRVFQKSDSYCST